MNRLLVLAGLCAALLSGCAAAPKSESYFYPDQVRDTELAFARTMAARDHAAFSRFIAEDAIFFDGDRAIRGKARIAESWKPYFSEPQAPFSWGPSVVQVLDTGNLALTSGPVFDPAGKLIGRFNSIWRQEAPGVWRVVFDKGSEVCNCAPRIETQIPLAQDLPPMAPPVPIAPETPAGSESPEQPLPAVTGN
ncbi:MAG: nuclear transport factor 2 family protein [Stagnimonas sp.]|nr:nuclear transport factor 2 family protein [Stagnimonas sp.]